MGAGAIIDQFPGWLRPVVGPLVAKPAIQNINASIKLLSPMIEERVRQLERGHEFPEGEKEPVSLYAKTRRTSHRAIN